jgi:hypothetical protein
MSASYCCVARNSLFPVATGSDRKVKGLAVAGTPDDDGEACTGVPAQQPMCAKALRGDNGCLSILPPPPATTMWPELSNGSFQTVRPLGLRATPT